MVQGNFVLHRAAITRVARLKQIVIVIVTAVLLAMLLVPGQKTPLGRAQRACEQDRKMAALLGIDVDRTISITFIMGAALAAVAGTHVPDVLRRRGTSPTASCRA